MMKSQTKVLFLILILGLISCGDDVVQKGIVPNELINFKSMAIGQSSTYIGFQGERYFQVGSEFQFEYNPDTLVVEIVEKIDGRYLWRESLTEGSDMYESRDVTSFEFWVTPQTDGIFIELDETEEWYNGFLWRFFGFGFSDGHTSQLLPFELSEPTPVDIIGWKTTAPYAERYSEHFDNSYQNFGLNYGFVNVIIANEEMQLDGPGKTYVWNEEYGMIRSYSVSWWTQDGYGWDLLTR